MEVLIGHQVGRYLQKVICIYINQHPFIQEGFTTKQGSRKKRNNTGTPPLAGARKIHFSEL